MVMSRKIFENLLIATIESKNEQQFKYIVNILKVNLNEKLSCLDSLSIFEKVLLTPNSQNFITLCLQNGSKFYHKNVDGIYPLFYSVASLCRSNLNTLLQTPKSSHAVEDIKHVVIVNEKFDGGNNYLHLLIDKLSNQNYNAISEMIKTLIINRCSPNSPNDQLETPFYTLLKKLQEISGNNDLINFFDQHASVDIFSHKSEEIIEILEERDLGSAACMMRGTATKDIDFMTNLLEDWNEYGFIREFRSFYIQSQASNHFQNDLSKLLEAATIRNLINIVELLLDNGAQVNGIPWNSRFILMPAFLACSFGYHKLLKILLRDKSLTFKCRRSQRNLLHQICLSSEIHAEDRFKCFDLIIADDRCTVEIINELDGYDLPPLYYACHNGLDDIVKELLRRGAYIEPESIINIIDKEVFKDFLDECIKCPSDLNGKSNEIFIDYRFLVSSNLREKNYLEISPLHTIAENTKLNDLILHPVISSFLSIKWSKISFLVHFNILMYFCFMIYLGVFILEHFHHPVYLNHSFGTESSPAVNADVNVRPPLGVSQDIGDENVGNSINSLGSVEPSSNVSDSSISDQSPRKPNIFSMLFFEREPRRSHRESFREFNRGSHRGSYKDRIKEIHNRHYVGKRSVQDSINDTNDSEWNQQFAAHYHDEINAYRFCVFGVFLITIYEVVQFFMSYRRYLFKLTNWLDLALIYLSYIVLLKPFDCSPDYFKNIRALTILVMAAQTIQLVAKISFLSISLYMAIFKRVCATFLKTTALYLIMILAFAMSFYTLNGENDESSDNASKSDDNEELMGFANPFTSIITTVRMMLADFDNVKIADNDLFQGFILLLFIILITVVLFNLLNALAIRDTNEILKDAELVERKKRISILHSYEKLLKFFNIKFADILPEMSSIIINPKKDNIIRINHNCCDDNNVKILIHEHEENKKFIDFKKLMMIRPLFCIKGNCEIRMSNKNIQKIEGFVKAQKLLKT